MNGKLYFQFGSTFVMGIIAGFFLYLTVYAPAYKNDVASQEQQSKNAVVIEGQMYGGCSNSNSCASFRLLDDYSYNYQPFPSGAIQKGFLPEQTAKAIFTTLGTKEFSSAMENYNSSNCESQTGGLDFSYTVSHNGSSSEVDTCKTALAQNKQLQKVFMNAWEFMQNPTTTYPVLLEEGIGGFFIDRFNKGGTK